MTQSDDDLIAAVRQSLRDQAERIDPSEDVFDLGPTDQAAPRPSLAPLPVDQRRGPSRALVGVAAAVVLIVAVAGVVLANRDGADRSVQVVSGPDGGLHHVLPPLAPEGVDWFVSSYTPTDAFGNTPLYAVNFDLDGFSWELKAGSGAYPTDHPVAIGDWMVSIFADGRPPNEVSSAFWRDQSGTWMALGGLPISSDGTVPTPMQDPKPTTAEVADVVARLQPVDDARWLAALDPPDGAAEPAVRPVPGATTGDRTTRPLHLGLDAPPDKTRLFVQPWTLAQSNLEVDGFEPAAFRLLTTSAPPPTEVREDRVDEVVTVRGVEGRLAVRDGAADGRPNIVEVAPGWFGPVFPGWVSAGATGYNRSLSWTEAGSYVQLQFLDSLTVDEAIAVANALVVLDDARWAALLFPAPGDQTTETTLDEHTTDETAPAPPSTVPTSTPLTSMVPTTSTTQPSTSPEALRTRLELSSTTMAAGTEVSGQVVVNNDTGKPIDAVACIALFAAGLSNDTIDARGASAACASRFVIPEGESTWPVSVRATYASCSTAETRSIGPLPPPCLPPPDIGPPLPVGSYLATVRVPPGVPVPAPVQVTVT